MKRLFESRKVHGSAAAIPAPNGKKIFTNAPFIQCEQILVDKNSRQYLETIIVSKKNIENGSAKNTHKKYTK